MTAYAMPAVKGAYKVTGKPQSARIAVNCHPTTGVYALSGSAASGGVASAPPEQHQYLRFMASVGSLMTHV